LLKRNEEGKGPSDGVARFSIPPSGLPSAPTRGIQGFGDRLKVWHPEPEDENPLLLRKRDGMAAIEPALVLMSS
jgi:hypothetical protein